MDVRLTPQRITPNNTSFQGIWRLAAQYKKRTPIGVIDTEIRYYHPFRDEKEKNIQKALERTRDFRYVNVRNSKLEHYKNITVLRRSALPFSEKGYQSFLDGSAPDLLKQLIKAYIKVYKLDPNL